MRHLSVAKWFTFFGLIVGLAGCRESQEPADTSAVNDAEVRTQPQFQTPPDGNNADMNRLLADAMRKGQANLPAGHPPIDSTLPPGHPPIDSTLPPGHPPMSTTLPAGHPPINGGATANSALPPGHPPIGGASGQAQGPVAFTGDLAKPEQMLSFAAPADWVAKPARDMTVAIYQVPGPGDAASDPAQAADLAISHYPGMRHITLEQHVGRWAGQFAPPPGKTSAETVKQSPLEGAAYPTTLVDISGTYQAGSMMGGPGRPQENYRMLAAVMDTPQGPWFFKLTGPAATITAQEQPFLNMVRQAK